MEQQRWWWHHTAAIMTVLKSLSCKGLISTTKERYAGEMKPNELTKYSYRLQNIKRG